MSLAALHRAAVASLTGTIEVLAAYRAALEAVEREVVAEAEATRPRCPHPPSGLVRTMGAAVAWCPECQAEVPCPS